MRFAWILLLLFTFQMGYTQDEGEEVLEEEVFVPLPRSFGYGVSNLLESITKSNSYKPQVYLDFSGLSSKGFHYRIGLSFNYRNFDQGNIKQHEWIPMNITFGIEKKIEQNMMYFILGADAFYSMSVRKTALSPFQFDDYGVGVAPYVGAGYYFREDISIFAQYEVGIGYFRAFTSAGGRVYQTAVVKINFVRNLSIGMRHFF